MRRNLLIFIGATLLVFVLFFFFVFSPQSTAIDEAKKNADAAELRVQKLELELSRLRALQRNAPQLREQATVLDAAVPNDPQLAQFISQVQDSADASGVEWIAVTPGLPAPSTQPGVLEVTLAMNVAGGYFQVQDFIVRLETLARAVKVSAVGLAPTDQAVSGSPTLTATMTMKMFISSTSSAPPATTTPAT